MFDYKRVLDHKIEYINLAHVVHAMPILASDCNAMVVTMSNGYEAYLVSNWKGRDDVARFIKAMETGVIEKVNG